MKVQIPGFVAPITSARVELKGIPVILRPKDRWPIFEEGAPELRGIEHLMGPLEVDYPAPVKPQRREQPKETSSPREQTQR